MKNMPLGLFELLSNHLAISVNVRDRRKGY